MANEEHVKQLRAGVKAWNQWRLDHPEETPDLSGADFDETDLRGVNLAKANLKGIYLQEANLQRARLSEANLESAHLDRANLQGADMIESNFQHAWLSHAKLQYAVFWGSDFRHASLSNTEMQDAVFFNADLQGASLTSANMKNAKLDRANLQGAHLQFANLEYADIRGVKNMILNSTLVRHAHFDARAKDPWSILRRTYSGPKLFFNLFFLVAFLSPYVVKLLFWGSVNRAQMYSGTASMEVETLEGFGLATTNELSLCLAERCDSLAVWQLLLGVDQGWMFWMLPVTLIVYNLLKAGLTWVIAPMRDEEERSGYCPAWSGYGLNFAPLKWSNFFTHVKSSFQGYQCLYFAHRWIVSKVFWIAVAAFAHNAWYWLTQVVWIPA